MYKSYMTEGIFCLLAWNGRSRFLENVTYRFKLYIRIMHQALVVKNFKINNKNLYFSNEEKS